MELKTKHEDLTMRRVLYDTLKEKRDRMKEDLSVIEDMLSAVVDDTAFELADVGTKKKKKAPAVPQNGEEKWSFPNLREMIRITLKDGRSLTATEISKELQASTYHDAPIRKIQDNVYAELYRNVKSSNPTIEKHLDGTKVKYQLAPVD